MTPLTITKNDPPALRVFSISNTPAEMASALKTSSKAEIASALLGHPVPDGAFELFPLTDLEGVGLTRYLVEGQGIPEAEVANDRARLEALDGYVLILRPGAFRGQDVTLPLSAELTLIGTYREEQPDMTIIPIESAAAEPYTGVPRSTPVIPPKGKAGSALLGLAIIAAALLLLWWILL